jgi:hypothetical protein
MLAISTHMDFDDIQDIVRQLNDAELAALVCLVADQHCLIRAAPESLDKLQRALQLVGKILPA